MPKIVPCTERRRTTKSCSVFDFLLRHSKRGRFSSIVGSLSTGSLFSNCSTFGFYSNFARKFAGNSCAEFVQVIYWRNILQNQVWWGRA